MVQTLKFVISKRIDYEIKTFKESTLLEVNGRDIKIKKLNAGDGFCITISDKIEANELESKDILAKGHIVYQGKQIGFTPGLIETSLNYCNAASQ